MDRTAELRHAHDVLAPIYRERLATILDTMPIERAVLGLWSELVHEASRGRSPVIGDVGCGTGRMATYLLGQGMTVTGVDLSPEMVRVAREDHPGARFAVGDVRALPWADGELDGALCWYSLMYLPPADRPGAWGELARVVRPGGLVAMAWKLGDDTPRRGGKSLDLGIGFDIWWMSRDEVERRFGEAGFETVMWAGRPAEPGEPQDQGYLVARRV